MGYTHTDVVRRWFLNGHELKGCSIEATGQTLRHVALGLDLAIRANSGPFVMLNSDMAFASWNTCAYYIAETILNSNAIVFSFTAARHLGIDIPEVELIFKHKLPYNNRSKNVVFKYKDRIFMTCSDHHWRGILELDFIPEDYKTAYLSIIPDAVKKYNVPLERIYFDLLVRPISTEPNQANEFLKAVSLVKKNLKAKTVCGLSNISFGLPNRKFINATFLTMSLYAGLTAAIIDPTDKQMMLTVKASETLLGQDEYCMKYIAAFREGK